MNRLRASLQYRTVSGRWRSSALPAVGRAHANLPLRSANQLPPGAEGGQMGAKRSGLRARSGAQMEKERKDSIESTGKGRPELLVPILLPALIAKRARDAKVVRGKGSRYVIGLGLVLMFKTTECALWWNTRALFLVTPTFQPAISMVIDSPGAGTRAPVFPEVASDCSDRVRRRSVLQKVKRMRSVTRK